MNLYPRKSRSWREGSNWGRYAPPQLDHHRTQGFVTAELAVNLISLTMVFIFMAVGLSWGYAQFVVTDAARAASRMLARGETSQNIKSAMTQKFPRTQIDFRIDDDLVMVSAAIAPWAPAFVPSHLVPSISANASADVEGWGAWARS